MLYIGTPLLEPIELVMIVEYLNLKTLPPQPYRAPIALCSAFRDPTQGATSGYQILHIGYCCGVKRIRTLPNDFVDGFLNRLPVGNVIGSNVHSETAPAVASES